MYRTYRKIYRCHSWINKQIKKKTTNHNKGAQLKYHEFLRKYFRFWLVRLDYKYCVTRLKCSSIFRKEAKIKVKLNSRTGCRKQKYSQKFCEKWLSLFDPWLRRSADDPNKPFCRACQCRLDCNRCHLVRHERTTKHKRNLESLVTKGEGAVRKELSVRQERSKYYHQRKRALKAVKQEPVPTVRENNLLEAVATAVITTDGVIEERCVSFMYC